MNENTNIEPVNSLERAQQFIEAAIYGPLDGVKVLLAQGDDVNQANSKGRTALTALAGSLCRDKGKLAMFKFVLAKGANVNYAEKDGTTALIAAANWGKLDMIKVLLAQKAAVDQADKNGKTALIWGANRGYLDVVEVLLAKGADVNQADNDGKTALIWAASLGHLDVVEVLLAKGADVNQADNDGKSALIWAAEDSGNLEIVGLLHQQRIQVFFNKLAPRFQKKFAWPAQLPRSPYYILDMMLRRLSVVDCLVGIMTFLTIKEANHLPQEIVDKILLAFIFQEDSTDSTMPGLSPFVLPEKHAWLAPDLLCLTRTLTHYAAEEQQRTSEARSSKAILTGLFAEFATKKPPALPAAVAVHEEPVHANMPHR